MGKYTQWFCLIAVLLLGLRLRHLHRRFRYQSKYTTSLAAQQARLTRLLALLHSSCHTDIALGDGIIDVCVSARHGLASRRPRGSEMPKDCAIVFIILILEFTTQLKDGQALWRTEAHARE
jgi:hypothetical protein